MSSTPVFSCKPALLYAAGPAPNATGVLNASQLSYTPPILPPIATLHATLLTKVDGAFTRFQAITFITGPIAASFVNPYDGATGVTSHWFVWTTRAEAQNDILVIGTTLFGTNVYNFGLLGISTELAVPTTCQRARPCTPRCSPKFKPAGTTTFKT